MSAAPVVRLPVDVPTDRRRGPRRRNGGGYFGIKHSGDRGKLWDWLQDWYAAALLLPREDRRKSATILRIAADFLEHGTPPPAQGGV